LLKYFLLFLIIFSKIFSFNKCDFYPQIEEGRRISTPNWEKFIFTQSGEFIIYFDTLGIDAPDTTDLNQNNIPDYIDLVAHSIDSIKFVLCDLMGYKSVPSVGGNPYPIYVSNRTSGSYGINYGGGNSTESPNGWVEIDNDYSSGFHTSGIVAMQVTLAHEYFHAVQRKYREITGDNVQNLRFFYELSSTWIEEIIYPNHDDYIFWVDNFFSDPTIAIEDTDGYSIALFGHYINNVVEKLDGIYSNFNRFVWEMLEDDYNPPRNYMNQILEEDYNLSFMDTWADFIALNYFNGNESSLHFYPDQINMDKISTPNPIGFHSFYSEILPMNLESVTLSSVKTNLSGTLNINYNNVAFGKIVKLGSEQSIYEISENVVIPMQSEDVLKLVFYGNNNDEITFDYNLERTPTTPSNLNAIENNGSIELYWNHSLNSGDSLIYYIYRNNLFYDYSDSNFYKDEDVDYLETYFYQVKAWNENGFSGLSSGINIILLEQYNPFQANSVISIYPNAFSINDKIYMIVDASKVFTNSNIKLYDLNGSLVNQYLYGNLLKGRQRLDLYGLIPSHYSSGIYFLNFCFDDYNCSSHKITWLK
tara:strand:+ start:950 stop:2716 length:1767 start_codon:yes stop_codon:yes gene_type:complete